MHFRKLVGLAAIISALTVAGAANGDSATWGDPSGCVLEARANLCPGPNGSDDRAKEGRRMQLPTLPERPR
jgi:hypothetical protein